MLKSRRIRLSEHAYTHMQLMESLRLSIILVREAEIHVDVLGSTRPDYPEMHAAICEALMLLRDVRDGLGVTLTETKPREEGR